MQKLLFLLVFLFGTLQVQAQSPVGRWKLVASTAEYEGTTMDMYAALIQHRPCAAKIVYEINADATYRVNAAESGCDEKYRNIQERLYSKTKWKLEGNIFTTSATNFEVGQSYKISFSGNKMTWVGTEGQGTSVYEKL